MWRMEVCPVWVVVLYFVATFQIVNTSVNTSLNPKVTTSQSSDYSGTHISSAAVDGCITQIHNSGCCSHTHVNPEPNKAWWQINLGDQVVVDYIQIYYRDEGCREEKTRFAGYQIYQSNTTNWINSDRCYTDTTSTRFMMDLAPQITSCTGNTRYLTIYVDRRTKRYSWYSDKAVLELCEVQVYGCPVGNYGNSNCDSDCDTTCVNNLCHPNTGQCTNCAPGFYKSGRVCTACPTNCLNRLCNMETGVCPNCEDGFYGAFCVACSPNCADRTCDKVHGNCSRCEDGFFGPFCEACPSGCTNSVCEQVTGYCSQCDQGFRGNFCNYTCPSNCKGNTCTRERGICKGCEQGFHGSTCQHSCPITCKDNACGQFDGLCEECADGFYGKLCDMKCPSNCKDNVCNQTNGRCAECVSGFHGSSCGDRCGYCQDGRCDKDTGNCMTSCIDGLTGDRCDIKVLPLPSKEDDFNGAAVGLGSGFGLIIVALVIGMIVQARRHHLERQQNTTRSNISLSNIGQDLQTETGSPYTVIGAQKRDESIS